MMSAKDGVESILAIINPERATRLVLTNPEDPMNTPITRNKKPYMRLKNTADRMTVSRCLTTGAPGSAVHSVKEEVLVTVKHALIGFNSIQFSNHLSGKAMKAKDWLKETKVAGRRKWTMQTPIGECCWVVGAVPNRDERLLLVAAEDNEHRIAWVTATAVGRDPYALYVSAGSEAIHDMIIISFGIIEEIIRMKGLDDMAKRGRVVDTPATEASSSSTSS
ncbi:hypothetical protein CPB83DRAFT_851242 [Crepidotus variabilis]|uniref:DUF6593 domain-containing protein n=1 Tax=Crepidotus variabilis TaxID=179855 RepID=A0A9P6JR05_9AGAR|nr:hypothetical protein CPB83DRAFT_851242 [Crepidotus variabilis]